MSSGDSSPGEEASSAVSSTSGNSVRDFLIDDEADEGDVVKLDSPIETLFPQFMRLPPELRHRIWQFFCPDLTAKARVVQFIMSPSSSASKLPGLYTAKDHLSLADQTEALRTMLATHIESRSLALNRYPDELEMDAGSGDAIVRFQKETDVVFFHDLRMGRRYHLPSFTQHVRHVALDPLIVYSDPRRRDQKVLLDWLGTFSSLKTLFYRVEALKLKKALGQIRWCASNHAHRYLVETWEKEPGLGEDIKSLFCWPDLGKNLADANRHIHALRSCNADAGCQVWPIVEFEFDEGLMRYDKMRAKFDKRRALNKDYNSMDDDVSSLSSFTTQDDEDTFTDTELSSGDEFEFDDFIDDDEPGDFTDDVDEPGLGHHTGPPPLIDHDTDHSASTCRFSSVEDDSSDSDDGGGEDDGVEGRVQRSRKRKIVADSEDDVDVESHLNRARRARVAIDSDSDEDSLGGHREWSNAQEDSPGHTSLLDQLLRPRDEESLRSSVEDDSTDCQDQDSENDDTEDPGTDEVQDSEDQNSMLDIMAEEEDSEEEEVDETLVW